MRILVAVPHYRPDGGPSAPLFTSLCEGLVERGHQVTVLTSVPHYPSGQVPQEWRGKLRIQTEENGVCVIRVALPSLNRRSFAQRTLQFLAYQIGAVLAGWNQKYDVYLTVTAAFQVWLPFALFAALRRSPSVYSVHDVYPDVGVSLGVFRHKPVIRLVAGLENFCLKRATKIRVLSESFIPGLLKRGVPESKIHLIYDWIDTGVFRPLPRDNTFALEHALVDRFVVLYAGNLGPLQGLHHVLDAADLLREYEDIRFVFVGDGAARKDLEAKALKLNLSNVEFLGYQPFERMPEILATSDISLVSLVRGSGFGALPSKSYGIFASGRPVLTSIDEGCEAWNLVQKAEAGLCIPPEDPARMAEAVLTLREDENLREQLGRNGRLWAEQRHSPQAAAEAFEQLLFAALAPQVYAHEPSARTSE